MQAVQDMNAVNAVSEPEIQPLQPIPTWFKVGGGAARFARPDSVAQLRRCLEIDAGLRVLGDGANLLVDDDGVDELVVALDRGEFTRVNIDGERVHAGAGVKLPRLINAAVREGLAGLEGLGGIPATLGGAVVMNAGGSFGQIADVVRVVHALDRAGREITLTREEIDFGYRRSGLGGLLITGVELGLTRADADTLKAKLQDVMNYKKASQPLGDNSAGCCFKNPTLERDIEGIGAKGQRVSAGMIIDRAGLKGTRLRSAEVSPVHGNFLVAEKSGRARDVIELMDLVTARVRDRFGIELQPEVVVWRKS